MEATRKSVTAPARSAESLRLCALLPVLSVRPWISSAVSGYSLSTRANSVRSVCEAGFSCASSVSKRMPLSNLTTSLSPRFSTKPDLRSRSSFAFWLSMYLPITAPVTPPETAPMAAPMAAPFPPPASAPMPAPTSPPPPAPINAPSPIIVEQPKKRTAPPPTAAIQPIFMVLLRSKGTHERSAPQEARPGGGTECDRRGTPLLQGAGRVVAAGARQASGETSADARCLRAAPPVVPSLRGLR